MNLRVLVSESYSHVQRIPFRIQTACSLEGPCGYLLVYTLIGGLEHLDYFSIQLGISSSQLTKSYFSEGWLNHQPDHVHHFLPPIGGTYHI